MIALVRYGFLGYHESNIAVSFVALALVTAAITAVNFRMFDRGTRLRA
jgi:ABC-2 type transport system permease protein